MAKVGLAKVGLSHRVHAKKAKLNVSEHAVPPMPELPAFPRNLSPWSNSAHFSSLSRRARDATMPLTLRPPNPCKAGATFFFFFSKKKTERNVNRTHNTQHNTTSQKSVAKVGLDKVGHDRHCSSFPNAAPCLPRLSSKIPHSHLKCPGINLNSKLVGAPRRIRWTLVLSVTANEPDPLGTQVTAPWSPEREFFGRGGNFWCEFLFGRGERFGEGGEEFLGL